MTACALSHTVCQADYWSRDGSYTSTRRLLVLRVRGGGCLVHDVQSTGQALARDGS